MFVKHYTLPPICFPRYCYSAEHVGHLLERFGALMKQCHVEDPFPIPELGDVNIYVISDHDSCLVSDNELTKKPRKDIKSEVLQYITPDELKTKAEKQIYVSISTCEQANRKSETWEYLGQTVLLIKEEPGDEIVTRIGSEILCVTSRSNIAKDLDLVLERLVFKNLFSRVNVLKSFMHLHPAQQTLTLVNPSIKAALDKKLKTGRLSRPLEENMQIYLYKEWQLTRLTTIKAKVQEAFGKEGRVIADQILEGCSTEVRSDVQPLTICEHIMPHLQPELVLKTEDHPPKSSNAMLVEIQSMLISGENQAKGDRILYQFKKTADGVQANIDAIEELLGECMGMYFRSSVPEVEKPRPYKICTLTDTLSQQLLSVKGVVGCGYRFTTLDIHIDDSLKEDERTETEEHVRAIITKHEIQSHAFHTMRKETKYSKDYCVGSVVSASEHYQKASLGGFALKGRDGQLSLLLARHFSERCKKIYVNTDSDDKVEFIAEVMQPRLRIERLGSLDIGAASVVLPAVKKCKTQFKDEDGYFGQSTLRYFKEDDLKWLQGLPVYIWGASSRPGRGKIVCSDFHMADMARFVTITDRSPMTATFAKPGDSGAIVCANDPGGEVVHVISMFQGGVNVDSDKELYLSFRLCEGLLQLQKQHGEEFKIC